MIKKVKSIRKDSHNNWYSKWKCSCGKLFIARDYDIINSFTKSCGCYQRKISSLVHKKHGDSWPQTTEYKAWINMKDRCYNENYQYFKNYGGRGITVCSRWILSYDNFLNDVGRKPSKNYSLDRINNNGNYEPSNCRWATKSQQALNRRKPRYA